MQLLEAPLDHTKFLPPPVYHSISESPNLTPTAKEALKDVSDDIARLAMLHAEKLGPPTTLIH